MENNKYKTIWEWFETIPYPNLKKAALFYMKEPHLKCKSLYLAIIDGIHWRSTYEGYSEWMKVATWALYYEWYGRENEKKKYIVDDSIFENVENKWMKEIDFN
jgi:hypothetical protein